MDFYMDLMAYFASIVVLASFTVQNVVLLRALNCIGSFLFLIYSQYHGRYPLMVLNFMVILVNVYYIYKPLIVLWKEHSKKKS